MGFAALAAAATKAIGLHIDPQTLSQIARQGSGSACRSIYGGFVEWQKGEKGRWLRFLCEAAMGRTGIVESVRRSLKAKKVLSREGMKRTVETSPFLRLLA